MDYKIELSNLYESIKKMDLKQIKYIIETSPNKSKLLNFQYAYDEFGSYPFLKAIETGNTELFRLFIDYDVDIRMLAFCHAMYHAKLEVIELFLEFRMNLFIGIDNPSYHRIMRFYYPADTGINIYTYVSPESYILLILCCMQDSWDIFEHFYSNHPQILTYKLTILRFAAKRENSKIFTYALQTYYYTNNELLDCVNDLIHNLPNSNIEKLTRYCTDHELTLIKTIFQVVEY